MPDSSRSWRGKIVRVVPLPRGFRQWSEALCRRLDGDSRIVGA
jgi:hypothetical protein